MANRLVDFGGRCEIRRWRRRQGLRCRFGSKGERSGITRLMGEGKAAGGGGKGDVVVRGGRAMGGQPTSCQWLQAFTKQMVHQPVDMFQHFWVLSLYRSL